MTLSPEIIYTIAIATGIIFVFFVLNLLFKKSSTQSSGDQLLTQTSQTKTEDDLKKDSSKAKPKQKPVVNKNQKSKDNLFKHNWLSTCLKAHSDSISGIDFSSNGKYLISSGADRAVFLWTTKEFEQALHKNVRCNVEFDNATKVRFSPDSKSFVTSLNVANTVRAFKISKKEDGNLQIQPASIPDFPQKHQAEIINIGISCNAKFIMTCSKDTIINIWDVKGELLGNVDTRLMNNSYGAVSFCGRFFGACGFTPDVKVWEVCFDKQGNYREIKRAFELKGHSAGVYHFSYNFDATRMATVSKDETWKLWNTNVDYQKGQDPSVLLTGQVDIGRSLIALSPNSYSIAVATETNLSFYNTLNAKLDEKIENIFQDSVVELQFSFDNKYLAVAGDRHVKVFHNVTGFRTLIEDYTSMLKTAKNEGAKERFKDTIDEHKYEINLRTLKYQR